MNYLMFNRYLEQPRESFKNGTCKFIDKLCFAELLSYYYIVKKPVRNSESENCVIR